MQLSDMKALRAIYTHHRLLKPTTSKSLISFQNPTFSLHFHSPAHLRRSVEPTSTADSAEDPRPAWSVFSRAPATPKASIRNDGGESGNENEMGPASLVNGVSEIEKGNKGKSSIGKVKSGSGSVGKVKNGKGKVKISWVCSDCGESYGQWLGRCRSCGEFNTLKEFSERNEGGKGIGVSEKVRSWVPVDEVEPVRLGEVNRGISWKDRRIPLGGSFGSEVATVLGGGIVPGSLVLIGGDPGVGKSTLVLQIAALIAEGYELGKASRVLYVSGEESIEQIGGRADRMGIETEDLFLYSSTDIEDILKKSHSIAPSALIVDSIQTVYLEGVAGSAGGIGQVKECTSALLHFAKNTNIPVFLIGHVNKSGEIAGPRVLEHIVDAVLYLEGEKSSSYRLLRSVKNRFGSTDELGVFEMSQSGLEAVSNPGVMYLGEQFSDSEVLAGTATAVTMDGSRSFLIEIQALCVSGQAGFQQVNGIQASRASMIISVLAKQAGLKLQENAISLNVVSGVMLKETAGDLAIAAAICSSFLEFPIPTGTAFIGEIGLCGELRPVSAMDKRINTLAKLGYKGCIVPKSAEKSLRGNPGFKDIRIIGCKSLKEVINAVFRSN